MVPVRLSRSAFVVIALFVATWLIPAASHAAARKPHRARTHSCHTLCHLSPWQATLHDVRVPHHPECDDAAEYFDDRNDRTDAAPSVDLRYSIVSPVDTHAAPPWVRARHAAEHDDAR